MEWVIIVQVFDLGFFELSMSYVVLKDKVASHLNQIVGDYTQAYPSLHAFKPAIQASA